MSATLRAAVAVVLAAATAASPSATSSGTVRYLPRALLATDFTAVGSPVVVGSVLRLEATAAPGAEPAVEGLLSNGPGLAGDVVLDVRIANVVRHPQTPAYESVPLALLATAGYNLSAHVGPRAQQSLKLHSTMNETWMELSAYSNASETAAAEVSWQKQPALPAATVRIVRRGDLLWGGLLLSDGAGPRWFGAGTNFGSSAPPGQLRWLPAPAGPLRIGLLVDPDYANSYQIDVSHLDVWADADKDGLADPEENELGTSATSGDSDNDGVDDWLDVLPLDPTVGAIPFSIFANASAGDDLTFKLTGAKGAAILLLNNTANAPVSPGKMLFPGLAPGGGCVQAEDQRVLPCTAGAFADPVPLPPWGRRAYSLPMGWAAVVADVEGLRFTAGASSSQRVDLRQHIACVVPTRRIDAFSVTRVASMPPGLFSAKMGSDGHTLVVSTPEGPACGTANVAIRVTLGATTSEGAAATTTSVTVSVPLRKLGAVGPTLLSNGNFSGNITMTQFGPHMSGWKTNTWSGLFSLSKCPVGTPFGAQDCVMMEGFGAGKFGVYQTVNLGAGSYALSALMASVELEPGQWSGTTSIYASFSGSPRPDFPLLASGPGSTHDLLHGSSGWRRLNASFSTPAATNMTLYFFIWGSGRFFLEDVSLVQLDCKPSAPDRLALSAEDIAPLSYNVPLTYEDTLLCGYCNDTAQPAFNRTELCVKCAATNLTAMQPDKQAAEDKVLTEWGANSSLFAPDHACWARNANGTATIFAGKYVSTAIISADSPVDWSSYSYLQIAVYNPSMEAQPFSVEIRDTATVDYWSRVNWDSVVAPGHSTFLMPIEVYVGEKSEIKIRRMIDLKRVTRLALANSGAVNVSLGTIKLLPQPPFKHDFAKLLKVDVQPRTGPVLKTFTGLYPDTLDETLRGYGIVNTSQQGAVAQDREHPDDLMRDWIAFESGGLNFHLPRGSYGVWLVMEDAGYWEYYQNWKQRSVVVSGGASVNQTMDLQAFWARYYAHADKEDLPGQSSWHRYIKPRYFDRAHFLEATVEDGSPLTIRFETVDSFACTLSSLLVWPLEMNASATAFVEELQDRLLAQYEMEYMQSIPAARGIPPPALSAVVAATLDSPLERLRFFQPDITEEIDANGNPQPGEEIDLQTGITLTVAAKGEVAAYVCFVDPGANVAAPLPPLQSAKVTFTSPAAGLAASVRVVRYKQKRLTADGAVWANKPRLLIDYWAAGDQPLAVNNVTRCLWLEVSGPATAAGTAAVHNTELVLTFSEAAAATTADVRIPLVVTELAVALPSAAPLWVGWMGMLPTYPGAVWPEVREKQLAELEPSLEMMQQLGFSAATGGAGGPSVANESLADLSFLAHKRIFGQDIPVNSYMGSAIVGLDVRDGRAAGYATEVKAALTKISSHADASGWPDFVQTCGDEPRGDAVDASLAVGKAFADARAALPSHSKVGRTSVFTSVLNLTTDSTARLLQKSSSSIDLIVINEHSAEAIKMLQANGKDWMLYNGGTRFRVGFYLAMASHGYGCHGLYEFAFSSVHADPYYSLDSREDDLCAAFTTPPPPTGGQASSPLVLLLSTVQTMREGLNDLRFTKLLRSLVAEHRHRHTSLLAHGRALSMAIEVLAEIDAIPLGSEHPQWNASRILRVRHAVEQAVAALHDA